MKGFLKGALLVFLGIFVISGCGSSSSTNNYTNSDFLVSGEWLAANSAASNMVVIDVRSSTDYEAGHIANAINLSNSSFIETNSEGIGTMLKDSATLATTLGEAGVSEGATIIVYGANIDANAGRMFWMLEYLGAADVHILDGGYDKWVSDGHSVETTASTGTATTFTASVNDAVLATKAYVSSNYNASGFVVVDSRNAADYDTSHIPGAINLLVADYLNSDGTAKSYADLVTLFNANGITSGKTIITHCYVGYRSGQAYFFYRLMGYTVRNYDGSWTEWSADSSLPTEP